MNRIIKFRAWSPVDSTMYEPFDLHDILTTLDEGERWSEDSIFLQSTGLTDKNGTEIYEGDIMGYKGHCSHVVFMLTSFRFNAWMPDGLMSDLYKASQVAEVIGNIYEHPHLLNPTP